MKSGVARVPQLSPACSAPPGRVGGALLVLPPRVPGYFGPPRADSGATRGDAVGAAAAVVVAGSSGFPRSRSCGAPPPGLRSAPPRPPLRPEDLLWLGAASGRRRSARDPHAAAPRKYKAERTPAGGRPLFGFGLPARPAWRLAALLLSLARVAYSCFFVARHGCVPARHPPPRQPPRPLPVPRSNNEYVI